MSVIEDVRPIGVRPAERRPVRALALVTLSRAVLGALVVAVGWAVSVTWSVAGGDGIDARPLVIVEREAVVASGTSIASLLDDVRGQVGRQGGSLVGLEMTRGSGATAAVRLTVDLPGTGAARVDRLVAGLTAGALTDLVPRSVDPVPSGMRVGADASVELAAAPPDAGAADGRAAAVALAEVAERAGVELRGVDVPTRPQDPVRLVASGGLHAIVAVVDIIEQEHSAPLRFRSVSLRRTTQDAYEAVLTFALREDVARTTVEVTS